MVHQYELLYFDLNARAGGIRLLLDYLGIPFKDTLIAPADWPKIKPTTPYGKVPVLIVNKGELKLSDTIAILHYIAAKHGALPATEEQRAVADSIAGLIQDLATEIGSFISLYVTGSPEADKKYATVLVEAVKARIVPLLEIQLKTSKTGYLFGEQPTWIDFFQANFVDNISVMLKAEDKPLLGQLLVAHRDRVFSLPHLETHLSSRQGRLV